ncbi:MAG: kelch repeat-containing protein [Stappiaceae bacterium]
MLKPNRSHVGLLALCAAIVMPIHSASADYHQASEAWETVQSSDGSAPTARHEAAFVAVNERLYLLGGRGKKPVDIFDVHSKTWWEGASSPIEIHHFQAVPIENEIWAVGAFTGGYPGELPMPYVLIYDTVTDTWKQGPDIPEDRRRGSTGAAVVDGKIYIAGGAQDGHRGGHVPWLDKLDPQTGIWTQLADAPRSRDHAALTAVDGKLVFAGGRRSHAPDNTFGDVVAEVDVFDIQQGTWTTLEDPLPVPRAGNASVAIGDDVLVIGGESIGQRAAHSDVDRLTLSTGEWHPVAPLLRGRHGTGIASIGNELWIAAGSGNRGGGPELNTLERLSYKDASGKS